MRARSIFRCQVSFKEFGGKENDAENPREFFNYRHESKQSVIERAFGVLKRRFHLLREAREGYLIRTQVRLTFALAAVHNFINKRQGLWMKNA